MKTGSFRLFVVLLSTFYLTGCATLLTDAMYNNMEGVREALNKGEDPNQNTINGFETDTPLLSALRNSNIEMAELLLKHGADPNKTNPQNETPLLVSVDKGFNNFSLLLLSHEADPDLCSNFGACPLILAAYKGETETVEILLKHGANPNVRNNAGATALNLAIDKGNHEIVRMLVENGANVDLLNPKNGNRALLLAVIRNDAETVNFLLSEGANPNIFWPNGAFPLIHAVVTNNYQVTSLLIDNGAKVNQTNNAGATALIFAAANGNKEIVELLLKNNAGTTYIQNNGANCLDVAVANNHYDIVSLLESANPSLKRNAIYSSGQYRSLQTSKSQTKSSRQVTSPQNSTGEQFLMMLLQGAVLGLDAYNKSRSGNRSQYNTYNSGCSSDYDCEIGNRCVKERYNSTGVCMKSVNEYGVQDFSQPDTDSIGPRMSDGCNFDTDCPIGFECDSKYNVCVKI